MDKLFVTANFKVGGFLDAILLFSESHQLNKYNKYTVLRYPFFDGRVNMKLNIEEITAMLQGKFGLEVRVGGRSVKEYPHQGDTFVVGGRGDYELFIRNNSNLRVSAVVSIDGLSVMTGKTASLNDGGYVIDPYDFLPIPGWRLDNNNIASFNFGSIPESYAAQMDKPQNIGVIGVAFFHEKQRCEPVLESFGSIGAKGCGPTRGGGLKGGSLGGNTRGGVGTGFGRQQTHRVKNVSFDRAEHPVDVLTMRYDTVENLEALGIQVRQVPNPNSVNADPFPGSGCTPPPNWRRG